MLTLEQLSAMLKDRRLGFISEATGVHANTLREIRDNPDKANPTWRTMTTLNEYFTAVKK
jgi:hypothetical protein